MTKKKFVFYDLDGTIVDTREDIVLAANHMVTEIQGTEITREQVYQHVGRGVRHLIQGCLGVDDEKILEKGFKVYRNHYAEHMLDHTVLYPGAMDLLKFYQAEKQAVITNKPDPFSTEILKALGVDPYLCDIIAGNSPYPRKPDPAAILALLKNEKIAVKDALFVGDSEIDLVTGRNADVDTILVSHGFTPHEELAALNPKYLVSNLSEAIELIHQKGW